MAPSSAGNPSWEENFLSNCPLQDWLRRIKEVSRQKYAVLSQPECTHLQACNAMPLLPLHTHQSEGRSTKHSLPYSNDGLLHSQCAGWYHSCTFVRCQYAGLTVQ